MSSKVIGSSRLVDLSRGAHHVCVPLTQLMKEVLGDKVVSSPRRACHEKLNAVVEPLAKLLKELLGDADQPAQWWHEGGFRNPTTWGAFQRRVGDGDGIIRSWVDRSLTDSPPP